VAYVLRNTDGAILRINALNGETLSEVTLDGYDPYSFCGFDSFNGEAIYRAVIEGTGLLRLVAATDSGTVTRVTTSFYAVTHTKHRQEFLYGNFRHYFNGYTVGVVYIHPIDNPLYGVYPLYTLLKRRGYDYDILRSGVYRERLDISNSSPLVTMDRRVCSLRTLQTHADGSYLETTHLGIEGYNLGVYGELGLLFNLGITSDDFRYAQFDDSLESGSTTRLLVLYSGSLGGVDLLTLDNFSGILSDEDSYKTRIETSNYYIPDQFIFITASGCTTSGWSFLQKDATMDIMESGVQPSDYSFVDRSVNFPQSRATCIRLDDRI